MTPLKPFALRGRLRNARWAAGFTLLELLVAITVLSIVSLIAWRGLDSLLATRARLEPETDEARALLAVFGQVERDLAHAITPQLFGTSVAPVGVIVVHGAPALSMTRIAPPEPDGATAVQVVGYRVDEGVLVRTASVPMRAIGDPDLETMQTVRLLTGVRALRLRLWQDNSGWVDPLSAEAPKAPPTPPPGTPGAAPSAVRTYPGVEFTIERVDGKVYRRVALVG